MKKVPKVALLGEEDLVREASRMASTIASVETCIIQTTEEKNTERQLENFSPDWLLCLHHPEILSSTIIEIPSQGALNLHPGKLPEYAGMYGYLWAIRTGEKETASTLHWMENQPDTGAIAYTATVPIGTEDTGFSLYRKMERAGISLIHKSLKSIANGATIPKTPQNLSLRKVYTKKQALDGRISLEQSADSIRNFVRAADFSPIRSPFATPRIELEGESFYVKKVERVSQSVTASPGHILRKNKDSVELVVGNGEAIRLVRHPNIRANDP